MSRRTAAPSGLIRRLWGDNLSWFELPLWALLAPLSVLYGAGAASRRLWWRLFGQRVRAKVISVGNLTVGGNGKTPFTLFIAKRMAARGLRVGIVSRGYGAINPPHHAALVADGGEILLPADEAGDEPVMMARAFNGPIAIARRRSDAIALLERSFSIDAVVLDDGFQHVRLRRDADLLLVNAASGLGNGWVLPAGPMRERAGAARRADAIVLISSGDQPCAIDPAVTRLMARSGRQLLKARLAPRALIQPELGRWRELPLALHSRKILAVSGLANPDGFYRMLRQLEADLVGVLEFPDHHNYAAADWQNIRNAASDVDAIITTEKDLVKLERFPFARDSLYALRVEITMDTADETRLLEILDGAKAARTQIASP